MMADLYVKLEPGDYDVAFEPSPSGPPHFIAVFSRGGARIATAPAELKGAPARLNVSDIKAGPSLRGTFDQAHVYKNGAIHAARFDVQVGASKAFYEALLTEFGLPASDADAKQPATVTIAAPKGTPPKR